MSEARKCPKCGKELHELIEKEDKTLECPHCGEEIGKSLPPVEFEEVRIATIYKKDTKLGIREHHDANMYELATFLRAYLKNLEESIAKELEYYSNDEG